MFWNKSRKRIKELEKELSVANKTNFDLSAANDLLKNNMSVLISEKSALQIDVKGMESEIKTLKYKLTRKKPIKKSEQ